MWNRHSGLQIGFSLMVLLLPIDGSFAEETKVSKLLHRYDVLKAHTMKLLDSARQARVEGQVTNDGKSLLYLRKDVVDLCFEVRKSLHGQRSGTAAKEVASTDIGSVLAMAYSCEAMEQVLEVEFDAYQAEQINPDLIKIQEKYEEVWNVADSFVTRATKPVETR